MSRADSHLVLHLRLDEIENDVVIDASDNDLNGQMHGQPQLVADATFGSCMRFGGEADYVTVAGVDISSPPEPGQPAPPPDARRNPAHTIAGWVRLERYRDAREWVLLLGQNKAGAHHWLIRPDGTAELGVWDGAQLHPKIPLGEWTHIATTYDGKLLRCYLNGRLASEPVAAAFNLSNYDFSLARPVASLRSFEGSMAGVRLYSRALAAEEIRQLIENDRTAQAAFRTSHPIEFSLHDADDQPVLAIVDDPAGHTMRLEITNRSGHPITLDTPKDTSEAHKDNHHFDLRFRPSVLAGSKTPITVAEGGWKLGQLAHKDGTLSVYLLQPGPLTLEPGDKIRLTLQHIAADGRGGARGTRVELHYGNLTYANEALKVSGYRTQHLNIVNQRGQQHIPLHVGFVGTNTIVNNGADQTLTLRIVNASPKPIQLVPTSADPQAYSRFVISFDVPDAADQQGQWALGTLSEVRRIRARAPGWMSEDPSEVAESPETVLKPPTQVALAAGEEIIVTLTPVKTELPSGHTNLYVRYTNIPGYWDGQFVCPIEKSPLIYRDVTSGDKSYGYVGVGTPTPQAKLQILHTNQNAEGNTLILGPIDASNLRLGYHQDYSWVQSHGAKPLAINPLSNSVGVGTTTPQAKLAINGGLHVGGDSDPGDDNLLVDGKIGLGAIGQTYIQRGWSINIPTTPFKTNTGGSMFANLNVPNGIKLVGDAGGALSTVKRDVLVWFDLNGIGEVMVNGKIWAQEKNFLIAHPTRPDYQLAHSCIEGPEVAVYYRGTAMLRDGRATIRLPEYFEALTRAEGRTVQLTPRGREPFRLSYDAVADGGFTVYAERDEGAFDWEVKAVRADVAELRVEMRRGG